MVEKDHNVGVDRQGHSTSTAAEGGLDFRTYRSLRTEESIIPAVLDNGLMDVGHGHGYIPRSKGLTVGKTSRY